MTLLANVLPGILHKVLLIARVKISRSCSTIDFTEDYFRQQSHGIRELASNFPFLLSLLDFSVHQEKFTTDEQKAWEKEQFRRGLADDVR